MVNIIRSLIRPLITLAFTTAVIYGFIADKGITGKDILVYQGILIAFWFGERSALKGSQKNLPSNAE